MRYFDAIIIVPLEEEFSEVMANFRYEEDLTTSTHIRFSVSLPEQKTKFLIVKQAAMGKTANQEAASQCVNEFSCGILICVGIAGALSPDVSIGDVCYSGTIIDVLDNGKIIDSTSSKQELAFSPTTYSSPTELTIPIALDRIHPLTKAAHGAWASEREEFCKALIPDEFSGKNGKKETIGRPIVREGAIACGLVSGSPEYNRKIRAIDRKVLAIETESGGLFSVGRQKGLPAITIRGISDYAGVDKNEFEVETRHNARRVAASNAASFLARQLGLPRIIVYLDRLRLKRASDESQLPLLQTVPHDAVADALVKQGEAFDGKLRDLAPGYSLQSKGYRLPVPRIRTRDKRSGAPEARDSHPVEVRDALRDARIITLRVPREYPDLSLSWIIASDLLSAQLGERQLVPCVIEGRNLQRPRLGVAQLIDPEILQLVSLPEFISVFIVDDFNFESRARIDFLKQQIHEWPNAKFIVVTRSGENVIMESDFTTNVASSTAQICDISFSEISNFVQKHFEMTPSASEVVAVRLRETFHKYALSAHPSYFAGIPRNTLSALLQANRRAELIELAVAGYLSFVVAEDKEPIALSRKTREKFLAEIVFLIRVECKSFTESQLTTYAEAFAKKFDFSISPSRFISAFIDNRILHVEGEFVRFTLPFMESYLLAKRLKENDADAVQIFFRYIGRI